MKFSFETKIACKVIVPIVVEGIEFAIKQLKNKKFKFDEKIIKGDIWLIDPKNEFNIEVIHCRDITLKKANLQLKASGLFGVEGKILQNGQLKSISGKVDVIAGTNGDVELSLKPQEIDHQIKNLDFVVNFVEINPDLDSKKISEFINNEFAARKDDYIDKFNKGFR